MLRNSARNPAAQLAASLLALGLFAGHASAQTTTPAQEVRHAASAVKQDVRTVTRNVKQDVKDAVHGDFRAAHQRHERVLSSTSQRHRSALRNAHQRRMTSAQCLARHGYTYCKNRGYRYGSQRHACKTASGRWVLCARKPR